MKTLKQLDRRALWQAFRNLLICIGGVAIAAFMGNLSRPVEICMAVGWLLAILAVLYGIEIGKSSLVLEGKRTAKAPASTLVDEPVRPEQAKDSGQFLLIDGEKYYRGKA